MTSASWMIRTCVVHIVRCRYNMVSFLQTQPVRVSCGVFVVILKFDSLSATYIVVLYVIWRIKPRYNSTWLFIPLQWRHNERDGALHHQPHIVYSTVYSGTDQRKDQSSVSLAFVRGIHWWPVNSPHKGPVMQKMFPFDDVIMQCHGCWGPGNTRRQISTTMALTIVLHEYSCLFTESTCGSCLHILMRFKFNSNNT